MRQTQSQKTYIGVHEDLKDGITPTGNIVRDAWVFGLIPESEDCKGWGVSRIESLYDRVTEAWHPYGHLVSRLPEELAERHKRIYDEAVARAHEYGWDPELGDND